MSDQLHRLNPSKHSRALSYKNSVLCPHSGLPVIVQIALRRLVAVFSRRRLGFDPRSVRVCFVVHKVSLRLQVSLPPLQFSPVSIIPPMLHTHSFTYHPRYIMFLSQYFSFPLSVSFHQCSKPIHSPTTHAI